MPRLCQRIGNIQNLLGKKSCTITLKVVFSSFYYIQRHSCQDRRCQHREASDDDHKNNSDSIRLLRSEDIQLSPFGKDDWTMLQGKLHIPDSDLKAWSDGINERIQEDINLKEALEGLHSS